MFCPGMSFKDVRLAQAMFNSCLSLANGQILTKDCYILLQMVRMIFLFFCFFLMLLVLVVPSFVLFPFRILTLVRAGA